MRKDDPQINLRVPPDLKVRIQEAAKQNRRTQTAEIIARLQESFTSEPPPADELIPANKARELSVKARRNASEVIRKRILDGIGQAVAKGHATALVDFGDLELEAIPRADQDGLISHFGDWLEGAGYEVEWDGLESAFIRFDDL